MLFRSLLFSFSIALTAQDLQTHLRRGSELMNQVIPGDRTAENIDRTRNAVAEFEAALRFDPANPLALGSLAKIAYVEASVIPNLTDKLAKLEEAERWYRRLASADPRNYEAPYSLGVIAWAKAYLQMMEARNQLGMRPEDPPPLRDPTVRNERLARVGPTIGDGIVQLETALAIDPKGDDAMAYMNLLLRLQADLSPTTPEALQNISQADAWVQKALETKRAKGEAASSLTHSRVPPPPPPPGAVPAQIRVGSNVQHMKLIQAPAPVYPPLAREARIQGVVRFNAVIDKEGRVNNLTLVSGHPLLVTSAAEAVRQYLYQPTLLNGVPVSVATVIDVNFTL